MAAEGAEDERQFGTHHPAAHNQEPGGHMIYFQCVVAGQDVGMIDGQRGDIEGVRARGDDDLVAGHVFHRAVVQGDFDQRGVDDPAASAHQPDFESGAGFFQPAAQGFNHLAFAGHDGGHVDPGVARAAQAEFSRPADGFQGFGRGFEGFGGNAAAVQAGAAHPGGFHQRDFRSGFGGFKGGGVAAGARADDGDARGHAQSLYSGCRL